MASCFFPSIQSFFEREVRSCNAEETSNEQKSVGDGFTSSEINEVLDPSTIDSRLPRAYEPCPIMLLQPGARHYEIGGRIVNFSSIARKRQNPEESEGFWSLLVSDGSGMIGVNLHCRHQSDYQPLLGQRITVWASFIGTSSGGECSQAAFSTSIFPGRAATTHILFHKDTDGSDLYRTPLVTGGLDGLMTLQEFLNTGYDYDKGKILVCVRSVGQPKTIRPRKHEIAVNIVEVGVFDHTASTMLTLWADKTSSANSWVPNKTILLISVPSYYPPKDGAGPEAARIGIGSNSFVEVDPAFARADWLRSTIKRMREKEAFFIHFPSDTWTSRLAANDAERVLYTIAEMEERIVAGDASQSFTGKLNVMILETSLLEHWRLGTICCTECCGVPLCANKLAVTCKNCGTVQRLFMNPRVLKTLVDESGCIAGSKLVWSEDAWRQLLLPNTVREDELISTPPADSWQQILELKTGQLREYEEELLYSRVTLTFG